MIEPRSDLSFSEFVAWETAQPDLHELINGSVPRRFGRSRTHYRQRLRQTPCEHRAAVSRIFPSTTIVQTTNRRGRDGYRPDVTVSCAPVNIGRREFITELRIVIEVTSPSNAGREWDLKLFEYWNNDSIEQLVLIGSLERETTSCVRGADGRWAPPLTLGGDEVLTFSLIEVTMPFARIYRNTSIAFSASSAATQSRTN